MWGAMIVVFGGAVLEDREVVHVAGVRALGVLKAVLLVLGIVVPAGRCERWSFATSASGGKWSAWRPGAMFLRSSATATPPSLAASQRRGANRLSLCVLQLDRRCAVLGCVESANLHK